MKRIGLFLIILALLTGCAKPVDKSLLEHKIEKMESLTDTGRFEILEGPIEKAQLVINNSKSTQDEVDNALVKLNEALVEYVAP